MVNKKNEENCSKKVSKRRKVFVNKISYKEGNKQFQCEICDATFEQKSTLNKHLATVGYI